MSQAISRAGAWLLNSGIQELSGGVARYYRADLERNHPISTEITGYAISAFTCLYSLTGDPQYLERAAAGGRFLSQTWAGGCMPFEIDPPRFTYFFDCGIIVRGLLALWRAKGDSQSLDTAAGIGLSMSQDFAAAGEFHPVLTLPDKRPAPRDPMRWSQSPGCYQLKAAMAWADLAEATGDAKFRRLYEQVLDASLRSYGTFLPGHPERLKVMDRLHAFLYFLEGLLPCANQARCAAAICDGIRRTAEYLRELAPEFERSDVFAQLLRMRLLAHCAGAAPLDRDAVRWEAARLSEFQASSSDPRVDGGFYFGRRGGGETGAFLPYVNPVSTAFALQALAMWDGADPGALI